MRQIIYPLKYEYENFHIQHCSRTQYFTDIVNFKYPHKLTEIIKIYHQLQMLFNLFL